MNKNCVIFGATGGLGQCLAKDFIKEDYEVFAYGRDLDKLRGIKCQSFFFDVDSSTALDSVTQPLLQLTKNKIDVFIYSAGIYKVKPLSDTVDSEIEDMFKVNIFAPIKLTRNLLPAFNKSKIFYLGSSSSYNGVPNSSIYCATKHALRGFALSMHEELKDKDNRVYFISPAGMKTKMGRDIVGQDYDTFVSPEDVSKFILDMQAYDDEMIPNEVRLNRYRTG